MDEIPAVDELAEFIGKAQRAGQAQSAEQLAAAVHAQLVERRRRVYRERKRAYRAALRDRELAHAS